MSGNNSKSADKIKETISLIACIVIGLTFLMSGIGKIFGLEATPPQVMDFIGFIIPDIFTTPTTIDFLGNIFIPYIFPWAELILGFLLIVGFMPLLIVVICIPLIIAFMGTNLLSIIKGGYATCASCFGMWEKVFGSLTPVQALIYDIVLFALAIVIIILYPRGFFSSRKWLVELVGIKKHEQETQKIEALGHCTGLRNLVNKFLVPVRKCGKVGKQNYRIIAISAGTGLIGLALFIYGTITLLGGAGTTIETTKIDSLTITNVAVLNITENSATISWKTNESAITSILIYSKSNSFTKSYTDPIGVTNHAMDIDGLLPNTIYSYRLSIAGPPGNIAPIENSFTTSTAVPDQFSISKVRVTNITEYSATITWTTNKAGTSEVEYWLPGSSSRKTILKDDLTTNHTVNLVALAQNSTYRFVIKSIDDNGTRAISDREETFSLNVGIEVGKQAPDFTLNSLDGKATSLSDYRGKVVMLDFWLWSCSGCRKKMTILQEVFARVSPEKIAILCINVKERESIIRNYATSEKITAPIFLDTDGIVATRYRITGFPTTFFLDANGIVRIVDAEFDNALQLKDILNSMRTGLASAGK